MNIFENESLKERKGKIHQTICSELLFIFNMKASLQWHRPVIYKKELSIHSEGNTLNTLKSKSRRQRLTVELEKIINIPCPGLQSRCFLLIIYPVELLLEGDGGYFVVLYTFQTFLSGV